MSPHRTHCSTGRHDLRGAPRTAMPSREDASPSSLLGMLPHALTTEPGPGPHAAACSLRASGSSVRMARDFAIATLRGWGVDALVEDAVVVVSELITNAVLHGVAVKDDPDEPRPIKLSLVRHGRFVVCIATDPGRQGPCVEPAGDSWESGRGLHVIEALSRVWGWTPLPAGRGKAVWAALVVPVVPPEAG